MAWVEFVLVAGTGFGLRTDQELSRSPSSTVLDAHPTTISTAVTGKTYPSINSYKAYERVSV